MHRSAIVSTVPASAFSLRISAGPIAWANGRSPRTAIFGHEVVIVDREENANIVRRLRQDESGVRITADIDPAAHLPWLARTFREHPPVDRWSDPVIGQLDRRYPGLRSFTDGSLFAGLVTSIIGQSISIASAMAAQRRLALSFHPGIEVDGRIFAPLPAPGDLAEASVELIRRSGVTWKRAEALKLIAKEVIDQDLPLPMTDERTMERELRRLPMVGPWTAASALLWGLGSPDAYPSGDVALLRAARLAYDQPNMTMKEMDALSERWRPYRAVATRLLWTSLLGTGWDQ